MTENISPLADCPDCHGKGFIPGSNSQMSKECNCVTTQRILHYLTPEYANRNIAFDTIAPWRDARYVETGSHFHQKLSADAIPGEGQVLSHSQLGGQFGDQPAAPDASDADRLGRDPSLYEQSGSHGDARTSSNRWLVHPPFGQRSEEQRLFSISHLRYQRAATEGQAHLDLVPPEPWERGLHQFVRRTILSMVIEH